MNSLSKLAAGACAVAICLTGATTAQASDNSRATVSTFNFTVPDDFDTALPECFTPDLVGTNVGVHTVTGRTVQTSSGVFHVTGTDVFDYRVDFPNGMYALGTATNPFSFTANPTGVVVSTDVVRELRTVYASDGTVVANVVIHAGSHITYRDLNGNGVPDPGEISANTDRFFFTCH